MIGLLCHINPDAFGARSIVNYYPILVVSNDDIITELVGLMCMYACVPYLRSLGASL